MKKILMTMLLLLALTMTAGAAAQNHRHTPTQAELADSAGGDAVEAYSDTTAAELPTVNDNWGGGADNWGDSADDWGDSADDRLAQTITSVFSSLDAEDWGAMMFLLGIPFIIFVLAPILILVALIYLIYKNHRQRMKLEQLAMQQGQTRPGQLLDDKPLSAEEEYQKGVRQLFVGAGLMIFLGYALGKVGFGVGVLVACIGLGKIVASKLGRKKI